ncbi:uncharacterized protein si:ch211-214j8.12 [Electrophorus electricus]|uniref:uncharacterized protein si:ch211-214j8.12 n=1 Tax=Electrophorus electricus TaxID=8005 RepID=UPI0015D09656|nr:uncharacterized protein si:ch211-214j8.12 [Electrophorus electricus]
MPLFRQPEARAERRGQKGRDRTRDCSEEEGDAPSSLVRLCLLNVAENMKGLWVQDYVQNYMDHYFFRYVMGPFSLLPSDLLEELLCVLSRQNLLSRAALHLLLLPQLRRLALSRSCNLVTANLCSLVGARCQSLTSLNLTGALNVSSAALCGLLGRLPDLRALCLAGTLSDRAVVLTVARRCPALEHLDLSRCLHLSPAALLALIHRGQDGAGLRRLASLLALDIGLGEGAGEGAVSGALLLLGQPGLRRLALEGAGRACEMIRNGEFGAREGLGARESGAELVDRSDGEGSFALEEIVDGWLRLDEGDPKRVAESKDGEGSGGGRAGRGAEVGTTGRGAGNEGEGMKLHLQEVQGVSLNSLDAVAQLCPDLRSLSLHRCGEDDDGEEGSGRAALLARGLATWAGRLRHLALQFPGALSELVPALRAAGSGLGSLTLEGVRADGHLAFLELLHACPKLTSLTLHVDPPRSNRDAETDNEGEVDPGLPRLPHLCSLTLNFTLDERQLRPVLCWKSLKGVLWALLRGSPHLHTLSLTAAPCPLDPVFQLVLDRRSSSDEPPLQHLGRVSLRRSDVTVATAARLVDTCCRLSSLDVSSCWSMTLSDIKKLQSRASRRRHKLQIIWT